MTIPGYDPDDVDDALEAAMSRRDPEEFLTADERARWEAGEELIDILDEDDLDRLLDRDGPGPD